MSSGPIMSGFTLDDLARMKVGMPFEPGEVLNTPGGTFTPAPGQSGTFLQPILVEASRLAATVGALAEARRELAEARARSTEWAGQAGAAEHARDLAREQLAGVEAELREVRRLLVSAQREAAIAERQLKELEAAARGGAR